MSPARPRRASATPASVFPRYLAFQAPGLLLTALLLAWAAQRGWIPAPWIAIGTALWAAKDLALFPVVWRAYEPGSNNAAAELCGRVGRARGSLVPAGYVELGPERWRAELAARSRPVAVGERVRVCGMRGLTLLVEPVTEAPPGTAQEPPCS